MIRLAPLLALCGCATAREARPTLADALPAEVVDRVRAIRDPMLTDWLATTDFDDGSIDAVQCRLGSCVSCVHAREFRPVRVRDQEWIDVWAPRCQRVDACAGAAPVFGGRAELTLAETMAPKDPVDACEHFRVARREADCHTDPDLEAALSAFERDFPRACVQADLFAADPEVRAARDQLAHRPEEEERDRLRTILDRKRVEYRAR